MPALQGSASVPAIFSARGHAAADVALRLVLLHHRLDLQIERAVPVRQPLGEVLVDRRFADAEMLRRGTDGGVGLDDVHSQLTGSLLNVLPHVPDPLRCAFRTLYAWGTGETPEKCGGRCRPPQRMLQIACRIRSCAPQRAPA